MSLDSSHTPPAAPPRRPSNWLQVLYLGLAVAGAVLPWQANLEFIQQSGSTFDIAAFVQQSAANPAARSLGRDLAIGASAITIWMISESRRLRMKGLVWVLLSCVTIAFAFGAPLFLFLRERRLQELAAQPAEQSTDGEMA